MAGLDQLMNDEQRREALETIPVQWRDCSFSQLEVLDSRCKNPVAMARAEYQAELLLRGKEWLVVLAGDSGEGKTSLACAMLRYAIEHGTGRTCTFVSVPDIAYRKGTLSLIVDSEKAWMLCIDDLGADPVYRDTLRAVIEWRQMRRRPTIVTTFMTEKEAQVYGSGIRRLYRDGRVVWVGKCPRVPNGGGKAAAQWTHGVNIDALRDEVVALRGLRDASNADHSKLRIEIDLLRARLQHAEAQREELLDCHPADGVSLCGACLSCWARAYNQVVLERDAAQAVLRDVEWSGPMLAEYRTCPSCGQPEVAGHRDCALAAAKGQG